MRRGIPEAKLIAETQGTDTASSAERVAVIMRTNRMHTCVAVSDEYHVFRIRKLLENEGVQHIFGVPGEENLHVIEALRRSTIKLVLTRHEQPAAFMAATHGRLTGRAGVCLSTLGPGALNLTTGAAFALLGAMPMVMITGQKGILSRKQARFQLRLENPMHGRDHLRLEPAVAQDRLTMDCARPAFPSDRV